MKINENIRILRQQNNLSIEEVATRVGLSRQTVYRYETGVIENIPYENIEALAKVFGVQPGVLMGWDDQESHGLTSSTRNNTKDDLISEIHQSLKKLNQGDLRLVHTLIKRLENK